MVANLVTRKALVASWEAAERCSTGELVLAPASAAGMLLALNDGDAAKAIGGIAKRPANDFWTLVRRYLGAIRDRDAVVVPIDAFRKIR